MRILQDNKQKLRQTRQEMIHQIRSEKKQMSLPSREEFTLSGLASSPKNANIEAYQSQKSLKNRANRRVTDDIVLQSDIYNRLSHG